MSIRILLCFALLSLLSSFIAGNSDPKDAQIKKLTDEISQLKKEKQTLIDQHNKFKQEKLLEIQKLSKDCDLFSLAKKQFNEGFVVAQGLFEQGKQQSVKGYNWLKAHTGTFFSKAAEESVKYYRLADKKIDSLIKEYKLEQQISDAEKAWKGLVSHTVKQVGEVLPQAKSYLAVLNENAIIVGQILIFSTIFLLTICFCRCCFGGNSEPKRAPVPTHTPATSSVSPPATVKRKNKNKDKNAQ